MMKPKRIPYASMYVEDEMYTVIINALALALVATERLGDTAFCDRQKMRMILTMDNHPDQAFSAEEILNRAREHLQSRRFKIERDPANPTVVFLRPPAE
jgi:hypothetical protein